jgi:simple sugar transport system ATP-binding protein
LTGIRTAGQHVDLAGVDLVVRAGELLGVAGVDGNGQTALARVLAGIERPSDGRLERASPDQAIGFVPAERIGTALVGGFTLAENAILRHQADPEWSLRRLPLLSWGRARTRAEELIAGFSIRGSAGQEARELSGGNQQKLVLARETNRRPDLLIVEQPTQGLDIGATAAVIERVRNLAAVGCAVVWISSNLDELLGECHRIVVLYGGAIAGELTPGPGAVELAGRMMLGTDHEQEGGHRA